MTRLASALRSFAGMSLAMLLLGAAAPLSLYLVVVPWITLRPSEAKRIGAGWVSMLARSLVALMRLGGARFEFEGEIDCERQVRQVNLGIRTQKFRVHSGISPASGLGVATAKVGIPQYSNHQRVRPRISRQSLACVRFRDGVLSHCSSNPCGIAVCRRIIRPLSCQ